MPTEKERRAAGFSLIEVLIAMVLLAIGMIALQGLSVAGTRYVARAQQQTATTLQAADTLERVLARVRADPDAFFDGTSSTGVTARGDTLRILVTRPEGFTQIRNISVTVIPGSTRGSVKRADSVAISSALYLGPAVDP